MPSSATEQTRALPGLSAGALGTPGRNAHELFVEIVQRGYTGGARGWRLISRSSAPMLSTELSEGLRGAELRARGRNLGAKSPVYVPKYGPGER